MRSTRSPPPPAARRPDDRDGSESTTRKRDRPGLGCRSCRCRPRAGSPAASSRPSRARPRSPQCERAVVLSFPFDTVRVSTISSMATPRLAATSDSRMRGSGAGCSYPENRCVESSTSPPPAVPDQGDTPLIPKSARSMIPTLISDRSVKGLGSSTTSCVLSSPSWKTVHGRCDGRERYAVNWSGVRQGGRWRGNGACASGGGATLSPATYPYPLLVITSVAEDYVELLVASSLKAQAPVARPSRHPRIHAAAPGR